MIEDDSVLVKYNEIWNSVKRTLNKKFHSMPVYDEKRIWMIKYQKKVCIRLV